MEDESKPLKIFKNKERLDILYEKGRLKNELNKLLLNKKLEKEREDELIGCTFKPFLYKKSSKSIRTNEKSPEGDFYERLSNWQNKLDMKNRRNYELSEKKDFSYKPNVNKFFC